MENKATVLETGGRASEMDLSILIVNWNSGEFLRRCLQSLEAQREEGVHFEVIVVDNASIDGSAEGLDRLFPWVKFIWNSYNYGFAKATNQAYRLSRGRYVMTLNPDTYLVPGALKRIIEFLDTHSDAGAVQPYTTYVYITRWHTPYWWQRIRDMLNPPKASSLPYRWIGSVEPASRYDETFYHQISSMKNGHFYLAKSMIYVKIFVNQVINFIFYLLR